MLLAHTKLIFMTVVSMIASFFASISCCQAQQNNYDIHQMNIEEFSQMSVYPLNVRQDLSRLFLLSVRGTPTDLSSQDLGFMANIFHDVYEQEQDIACGGENKKQRLSIANVEILPNEIIIGHGSTPRIIPTNIDFSLLVQFDFVCIGCQVTEYSLFESQESLVLNRDAYEVPFPSATLSQMYIKPCVPNHQDFASAYIATTAETDIPGLDMIYSADALRLGADECEGETEARSNFASQLTIAFHGDTNDNIPDLDDQLAIVEQVFIATYNQLNVLNPLTYDLNSRILTNATAVLYNPQNSPEEEVRIRRNLRQGRIGYNWKFLNIFFGGTCNGCPSDSCLTNDVSGHATCGSRRRRRRHRHLMEENESFNSCYCTEGGANNPTIPTNEEFKLALEKKFEILRNETLFSLIIDIVYLIEVNIPDSCCGWPVNGNIPVNVDGSGFQAAVTSYLDTGYSVYGYPINCWDVSSVTSMNDTFINQGDFNEPLSCWDTSEVTTMYQMFTSASNFNQDLSSWDTSKVKDMGSTFYWASSFNGDISVWDTSQVTSMFRTFDQAWAFNVDLSQWNTSQVTRMDNTFSYATSFSRDISLWDTSKVTTMSQMFFQASSFTSDMSLWDTSKVTNMIQMFDQATSFNGDVSMWDTGSVTDMSFMFWQATTFNGDVSQWDTSQVTRMINMFTGASQFQQNLCPWRFIANNLDYVASIGIFLSTNCPNTGNPPSPGVGPWCFDC